MCLCVRAPLVPIIACLIQRIRFWDKYNVDMLGERQLSCIKCLWVVVLQASKISPVGIKINTFILHKWCTWTVASSWGSYARSLLPHYWVALCLPNMMYCNKHIWFQLWHHETINHIWICFKQLFWTHLFSRHHKISSIMLLSVGTINCNFCMARRTILYDIHINIWFRCTDAHMNTHGYTHMHTNIHTHTIYTYIHAKNKPESFSLCFVEQMIYGRKHWCSRLLYLSVGTHLPGTLLKACQGLDGRWFHVIHDNCGRQQSMELFTWW